MTFPDKLADQTISADGDILRLTTLLALVVTSVAQLITAPTLLYTRLQNGLADTVLQSEV